MDLLAAKPVALDECASHGYAPPPFFSFFRAIGGFDTRPFLLLIGLEITGIDEQLFFPKRCPAPSRAGSLTMVMTFFPPPPAMVSLEAPLQVARREERIFLPP